MSEVFGNVYQLRMGMTVLGVPMVNVFYYCDTGSILGNAVELLDIFRSGVVNDIFAILNNHVTGRILYAQGVRGAFDFASLTIDDQVGARGGECLPPYAAYAFTMPRHDTQGRNGYKRFSGVSESDQVNGVLSTTTGIDVLTDGVAADLGQDLVPGTGSGYTPVILQRYKNKVKLDPEVYRNMSMPYFSAISTQNTRKFGRS